MNPESAQTGIAFHMPVVGEALGYTPVWEEWKGDFALAGEVAQQAMDGARETGDLLARADALIARALVHLLRGEIHAASKMLADNESLISSDAGRALLAFAYDHLATMYHYRLAPGGGLLSMELEQQWNAIEFAGAQEQRWARLSAPVGDDSIAMSAAIVYRVMAMTPVHRQMIDDRHSSVPPQKVQEFLAMLAQGPVQLQQLAAGRGASPPVLGYLDTVVADYAAKAGMMDAARQTFGRAYQFYAQANDVAGMARCVMAVGDSFAAPSSSPELWNLLLKESTAESSALTWRDELREFRLDDIDEVQSRKLYSEAAELFRHGRARRGLAALELRYAWLAALKDEFRQACEHLETAADLAGSCGDLMMQALARVTLDLARVGVSARAEDHRVFEEIGAWGTASGSVAWIAGLGRFAGRMARHFLLRRGDYERARACYRMTRALFLHCGMPVSDAQILVDLGNVHAMIGDRPAAVVHYSDALLAYKKTAVRYPGLLQHLDRCATQVQLQLYRIHEAQTDAAGIERVLIGLEEKFQGADLSERGLGGFRGGTGVLEAAKSDKPQEADDSELFLASVTNQFVTTTIETARVTAACYRAVEARDSGRTDQAEALFSRALSDARAAKSSSPDLLEAIVLAHRRDFDAAAAAYERVLAAQNAGSGFVERLVATMQQSPEGALEAQMQRQRIEEQAASFMLRLKQYGKAKLHFDALEEAGGPEWWKRNEAIWESLSDYGELNEGLGELERALEWYESGIKALEDNRRMLSAEELKIAAANQRGSRFLYFDAARCALKLMNTPNPSARDRYAARMFQFMEAGRARALLDLMATAETDPAPVTAARQLRARIATWKSVLAGLLEDNSSGSLQVDNYRARVSRDSEALLSLEKQLADASGRAPTISLQETQEKLGAGTCLIEYVYAGDELLVVAITGDGVAEARLLESRAATVDAKAALLQEACRSGHPWQDLAAELSSILVDPVGPTIRAHEKLIVVPHGATHHIPFGLLSLDRQLLGNSHVISYLPSASALHYLRRSEGAQPQTFLAIGNPADMAYQPGPGMAHVSVPPLPGAETEVVASARLFDNPRVLLRDQAAKRTVAAEMPKHRLVHFATHGHLDPHTPQLSGLLLAKGTILNVYELMGIRLDADLVVLSACDTGAGKVTGGNDIVGLSHAFLGAGARALIVSLWPVNDASATVTMKRMYEELRRGLQPAEALRAAQLAVRSMTGEELRREYDAAALLAGESATVSDPSAVRSASHEPRATCPPEHPLHWAPFIHVGYA